MEIRIILIILLFGNWGCSQLEEKEFDYLTNQEEEVLKKLKAAKQYKCLLDIEYKDFSKENESLNGLAGFLFRANEIVKTKEDSTSVFGSNFLAENYKIHVKTKIIGTQGIATVTHTNRTLKLKLSLIEDTQSMLKDSILNRIKITSKENKTTNYYAPWVIQLNNRGVFKNCEKYILWDNYYTKKEAVILYWVDNKCLKIGIAPEAERFVEKEFQIWKKSENETKEAYIKAINQLDYRGLFNYAQGCSFFIEGNEGGIKWKENDCEILFECESNIESKEILEKFK